METIQKILSFYQAKIDEGQKPFEAQASKLQSQLDELSQITWPVDTVGEVLKGTEITTIVSWSYEEIRVAEAMQLIELAIERLGQQSEKERSPTEKRMNYIIGSYKAVLTLKQTMLRFGNDVPINYRAQFTAECAALAQLINDAPSDLVVLLFSEINKIDMPNDMTELVA